MDLANGLHGDRLRGLQLCAHRGNQRLDEAIESPINLRPQFEVVRIIGKILQTEVDSLLETSRFPERLYVRPGHCKTDLIVSTAAELLHVSGRKLETSPCLSKLISRPTRSSWLRATVVARR